MKKYTEQEFVTMINKQEDLNFLAAAITPFHAMGIDATILQLLQQGIVLKGYIMVVAHNVTGTGISEEHFCMKDTEGIEVVQITDTLHFDNLVAKIRNKIKVLSFYMSVFNPNKGKNIPKLYWAVPLKPSYELIPYIVPKHQTHSLRIILLDEGIAGTYLTNTTRWWRMSLKEGGWKSGIRAFFDLFLRNQFFLYRLKRQDAIEYRQLLMGKPGQWVPNKPVVEAYKEVLGRQKIEKDFSYYSNAVVINSDMLKETGILKTDIDLDIIERICKEMQKYEIPVILKPHPREREIVRYEKLSCQIERVAGVAQESIWGTLTQMPYCVVGFASTTLVTAKLLFGIEAVSLNFLVQEQFEDDKKVFEKFNHTFKSMIQFPQNVEELLTTLNGIKEKHERN